MTRSRNSVAEYVKLEKRLVLLAWMNSLLGYEENRELLKDMKETEEGFDAAGRSYIFHRLESRGDSIKLPLDELARYDDNIKEHLNAINARRPEPITLRYFQYLAILYTEIFLDRYFNRRMELLVKSNEFVTARNSAKLPGELQDSEYTEQDLTKLAYWMATGSGKTLIMHFNYRQFLHYNKEPLDNILLITPNEGLTEQHMDDMDAADIPCKRFDIGESGMHLGERNIVRVIEITKLVEEKRGGGESVDVEAFEGNNLVFVDEGHKGSGGEAWRSFRDRLGQTGFTFEYSATFGQALTATRKDELTAEYGKAIIFDYSYKYFYGDGYGKDFRLLNLREETSEEKTDLLILGNLLSFYEQQRCFREQQDRIRAYNLEKPLWTFVGSSVNAVFTEDKKKHSDVLTIARFIQRFLENKNGRSVRAIKEILDGKTGLVDSSGDDIFSAKFEYLRRNRLDPSSVYHEVLSEVFHSSGSGSLHMLDIRGEAGEIGLSPDYSSI